MRQKMLETGIIRDIPAAPDYKREDRLKLAKAIYTNNKAMVRKLMPSLEKILNKSLTEMFPKAKKNTTSHLKKRILVQDRGGDGF